MLKPLTKSERQRLEKYFNPPESESAHPLYRACKACFSARAVSLHDTMTDCADLFFLVAKTLDDFLSCTYAVNQLDVNNSFHLLQNTLRERGLTSPDDRKVIADSVFRIVRILLCHHWDTYNSDLLYDMFTNTLTNQGVTDDDIDVRQMNEYLDMYLGQLDEWINNAYNYHLYDEVNAVLSSRQAEIKPMVPRGRKKRNPSEIMTSFNYNPSANYRLQRLQAFYKALDRRFIMYIDQQKFIDMFMGVETNDTMVWIGDIIELKYLIAKLLAEGLITYKEGGHWQVVCARFKIKISKKGGVDDSMTNDSYEIVDLKPSQFDKSGTLPDHHERLDRIVRMLKDDIDLEQALNDFIDSETEHDDVKDKADALAN